MISSTLTFPDPSDGPGDDLASKTTYTQTSIDYKMDILTVLVLTTTMVTMLLRRSPKKPRLLPNR